LLYFALLVVTAIVGPLFVRNYIFGYVLAGILLEIAYLTIHFLLNVLFAKQTERLREP